MEAQKIEHYISSIGALIRLVETLRGENGCPWDKKQTLQTIMIYLVEEIYELMDAIESGEPEAVCEELGDVWFHILFIASMFQESGHFNIGDVAHRNKEKMIRRHPHVFGNGRIDSADDVKTQWHEIKAEEKKYAKPSSVLDSIPKKTPALIRAYRVSERAAATGFDWQDVWGVLEKVEEELSELKSALKNNRENAPLEFGDVLFTLVNVARFARFHPETALTGSINKFEKRFRYMEQTISEQGEPLESVPRKEKENYWEAAKKNIGS